MACADEEGRGRAVSASEHAASAHAEAKSNERQGRDDERPIVVIFARPVAHALGRK
jgi:hypothetical protein